MEKLEKETLEPNNLGFVVLRSIEILVKGAFLFSHRALHAPNHNNKSFSPKLATKIKCNGKTE